MEPTEIFRSDYPVEIFPGFSVSLFGAEVITGGISVACVNSHTGAAFIFYLVYYVCDVFELISEV